MTNTILKTTNLAKSFGSQWALYNINITLSKGKTIGLIGPNGAGKTTLFSLLSGFLRATKGSIEILGKHPDDASLKSRISTLPQDANLLKSIPVLKQLSMLAELQGYTKKLAKLEALRVLKLVNLLDAKQKAIEQLSHGMLKRIAIAQAFIGSPELIMLDEPTAGLDPATADGIKSTIRQLQRQATIIISSHNLEVIEDLCEEVIILKQGRLCSHEQVSNLTARSKALTFRLEQDADDNIKQKLSQIEIVNSVDIGKKGQHRLVVHFSDSGEQMAEIEILKCLAQEQIKYREMIRGERLQEKMID